MMDQNSQQQAFLAAVQLGNLDEVRALLSANAAVLNVDACSMTGAT